MPDKWGRPTFNDWMQISGAIQGIGKQTQQAQQRQGVNKAIDYYEDNPDVAPGTGPAEATPAQYTINDPYSVALNVPQPEQSSEDIALEGVTPAQRLQGHKAVLDARRRTREDQQEQKKVADQAKVEEATNRLADLYKEGGVDALRAYSPGNIHEMVALGRLSQGLNNSRGYLKEMTERNVALAKKDYQKFTSHLTSANDSLLRGNRQEAEHHLKQAIDGSHHPLFLQKQKDGKYTLAYREGESRGAPYTDLTMEEALDLAGSVTGDEYVGDFVLQTKKINQENTQAALNPIPVRKGKKEYHAVGVKNRFDTRGRVWKIFDENGKAVQNDNDEPLFTTQDLRKKGFKFPPSVEAQKGALDLVEQQGDIAYNQAKTEETRQEVDAKKAEQIRARLSGLDGITMEEGRLSGTIDGGKFGTDDPQEIERLLSQAVPGGRVKVQRTDPEWFGKDNFSFMVVPAESQGSGTAPRGPATTTAQGDGGGGGNSNIIAKLNQADPRVTPESIRETARQRNMSEQQVVQMLSQKLLSNER